MHTFGIISVKEDGFCDLKLYEIDKKQLKKYIICNYESLIYEIAEKERNSYKKYIAEANLGNNVGIVNYVGRGVTQLYLSKLRD